jgi:hypothetical protein
VLLIFVVGEIEIGAENGVHLVGIKDGVLIVEDRVEVFAGAAIDTDNAYGRLAVDSTTAFALFAARCTESHKRR